MSAQIEVDGQAVPARDGDTILDAVRRVGRTVPTLCYHEELPAPAVCRLCVVELEGTRALVPACARRAEDGMRVRTDSDRVRRARRVVCELLLSAVDVTAAPEFLAAAADCGADPDRFGAGGRRVEEPIRDDNAMYVRDYAKCVLCYRCVNACGDGAQATFALSVAGRGFAASIDTGQDVPLPGSRCVFCGNCVAVCPTGALIPAAERRMRLAGTWAPERQRVTSTICPYCGVGCALDLHVQDGRIVKVTSPSGHPVTHGHLCVKGRYGLGFVHGNIPDATAGRA